MEPPGAQPLANAAGTRGFLWQSPGIHPLALALVLALACPSALPAIPGGEAPGDKELPPEVWTPLFDGATLKGWQKPFDWGDAWVEGGVIHLRGNKKLFLVTEKTYGDFILEAEVKVPPGGNSGVQFRSHFKQNSLWGYQAEVDTSERRWAGGLYDEGRRGWLVPLEGRAAAQAAFKNGEWNRYRIECRGARIRILVNEILTADSADAQEIEGHIALQHHGEKGLEYQFRNVRIQDLGRHRWKPLFDGKSLEGWTALPGGEWKVEEGKIVGSSPSTDPRHGILLSRARFGDFTVRVKYRSVRGNSGLYFRADKVADSVSVNGFQAEIDPEKDAGGLYETGGRGWVVQPKPEDVKTWFRPGEWNVMTVTAEGRDLFVDVNGHRSAEVRGDPGRLEGHFGLQLHGGQEMLIEFESVEVLEPVAR